jgi:hypothetical protein
MGDPAVAPAKSGVQAVSDNQTQSPATQKSGRGRKPKQATTGCLFALESEPGKNGMPVLSEVMTDEGEAILAAFRAGKPYFKLEKFKVDVRMSEGAVTLVSEAVS